MTVIWQSVHGKNNWETPYSQIGLKIPCHLISLNVTQGINSPNTQYILRQHPKLDANFGINGAFFY